MRAYETVEAFIKEHQNFNYMDTKLINENITKVLNSKIEETKDYTILTGGYMNPVFTFVYKDKTYVYRYPGKGSEKIVNRESEYAAHQIAKEIGLDESLIWINEDGHKISEFIEDFRYFDYNNENDVKEIVKIMQKLHHNEKLSGYKYDIYKEINNFYAINKDYALNIYPDLEDIKENVEAIYDTLNYADAKLSLCHNDIYTTNILMSEEKVYLIDWEFAKDTHPALDLTTFLVCSPYNADEIESFIKLYLADDYNKTNALEYYRYFIVGAFYWLLWALHVEAHGGDTEGFVEQYHHYLMMFLEKINRGEV